jgi:anti-sigma factor RsiW
MRPSTHVSDDRLVEVCFDRTATPVEDSHLASCHECRMRRSRLELMLREMSAAADVELDRVFPEERLAAQQTRILQRIEQDGRPARVIAFPAASVADVRPLRSRPAARWIAGAAAAGLAIGLLAGHLSHDLPITGRPTRAPIVRSVGASEPAPVVVNAVLNDEEFLGEIETALDGPQLAVLRPLNDLTPR